MYQLRLLLFLIAAVIGMSCSGTPNGSEANVNDSNVNNTRVNDAAPVYTYQVVAKYPHDGKAFTQGLLFHDGFLYESTGQDGSSTLRKVEISSGRVIQKHDLPDEVFGEGLALIGETLYQLSWMNRTAFTYNIKDLKPGERIRYNGEGWGLTTDGTNLIMSDGTHLLRYMDPRSFTVIKVQPVLKEDGKPLFLLNELEWVDGEIWANIWHSEERDTATSQGRFPNLGKPNYIARIDPENGRVVGWIDLAGISPADQGSGRSSENTLNGIAYDEATGRIWVTGKNWKNLYEIKVVPKE